MSICCQEHMCTSDKRTLAEFTIVKHDIFETAEEWIAHHNSHEMFFILY